MQESEAWLLLLLELVPVVGAEQLLSQVLPLALSHGKVNEPVANRVVCCRLLGAMTPHLVSMPRAEAVAGGLAYRDCDSSSRLRAATLTVLLLPQLSGMCPLHFPATVHVRA